MPVGSVLIIFPGGGCVSLEASFRRTAGKVPGLGLCVVLVCHSFTPFCCHLCVSETNSCLGPGQQGSKASVT